MKVLVADDEKNIRDSIKKYLELEQIQAVTVKDGLEAKALLKKEVFTAAIIDLKMPGLDGLALLEWLQNEGPPLPVIMISAYGEITDAVKAMKSGAEDYIVKPFDPEELVLRLKRIIDNQQFRNKIQAGQRIEAETQDWIGDSAEMRKIGKMIKKIATTPSTILITGASGTGKEIIARIIHKNCFTEEQPFIAINLGGIPENLLESELFGHEKGAFTGAINRKNGMFELATGGTLFLDEVGEMPLHLQVKLLRVLQEKKIQHLGSNHFIPVNARIIAATNRNLKQRIEQGLFREDLFFRLNVIHLELPPLRKRREDIPVFVGMFIKKYNRMMDKSITGVTREALKILQSYDYPGNIRELENIIERAVILAEGNKIKVNDLGIMNTSYKPMLKQGTLEQIEKQVITETLKRHENNKTIAAKELGISRRTLQYKLKTYGIK